ncbi:hypothetical protein [Lactiplantibacillus modestisalitolerans]|uniref:Lipoprotein n=1 Tax=Lactiplantibacillus modestisalitolerans TaxID=1457219 RepID=A0ABV5WRK8_9LACO|nr:hypothetical protein [Lactiplantibacillus modestisalitolerans]
MKKHWRIVNLIGSLILVVAVLSACSQKPKSANSSNAGYDSSISRGLNAVAEDKFERALTYFDNALTQKPKDKKAQAYRKQTQAYVDTQHQLKAGAVQKAVTTVTKGSQITGGATSLTNKLTTLKKTAKADLAEYRQLDKAVTAQLKVNDQQYDDKVLAQCRRIDWKKKPYLKRLKANVNQLLKRAGQSKSHSSSTNQASASTTSSSQSDSTKVSAADHQRAEQLRRNISQAEQGKYVWSELEKVPDRVVLQAEKKTSANGGDIGNTAHVIAEQYPNIKAYTGAPSDDPNAPGAKAYLNADEAKQELGALDFYHENQNEIQITGQTEKNDAWEFSFTKGDMTGTILVENKGIISAQSDDGQDLGMNTWR